MTGQQFGRTAFAVVAGAVALWAAVAYCLPVVLPFAIGLVVAQAAHPLARRLHERLHVPRWAAAFLCVSGVFAVLAGGLWLLGRALFGQLGTLLRALPRWASEIDAPMERLEAWLLAWCDRAPESLAPTLRQGAHALRTQGARLGERASDAAFALMGSMVSRAPEALLFAVTAVLSSFMLCTRLPELRRWCRRRLPERTRTWLHRALAGVKQGLGGWCRAQAKLLGVTFAIVSAGLLLLRQPGALVIGAGVALVDALPVLGAGTVLLPWALVSLLEGAAQKGISLILLYAITALTRATLEPRLLGRQLGLSPLLTLLAIYAGFRLCGVAGMLLFPIGTICLRPLLDLAESSRSS